MKKSLNVIGHLSSTSGLGNTARLFIEIFLSRGYEVVGLDVDYHPDAASANLPNIKIVKTVEELPFDTNFLIVSIQLLPSIWRRRLPGLLSQRFKNIGLVFYELSVVPKAWLPSLKMFDVMVVCSQYVRQALETALPEVPTIFAEHPLKLPVGITDSSAVRTALGLRQTDLVFSSSFDLRSDFSRKNPLAVLDAFQAAFPTETGVRLLVKANGKPLGDGVHPVVQKILARLAADPRVVLIAESMPYEKVLALYAACDVYVSLHRSEGLGLGPMEAMLLGKLVIATGYSGNMTYMNEQNSMPIPYRLVPPTKTGWQFERAFSGATAAWAEPDGNAAAATMRKAFEQPEQRLRLATRGKDAIAQRQETAWAGNWLVDLERCVDAANVSTVFRQANRRQMLWNEVLEPTLRTLNLKAIVSKVSLRSA